MTEFTLTALTSHGNTTEYCANTPAGAASHSCRRYIREPHESSKLRQTKRTVQNEDMDSQNAHFCMFRNVNKTTDYVKLMQT